MTKELEALKIIKSMNFIRLYETLGGHFVLELICDEIKMTKENYVLLKEVFDNDCL